MTSGQFKRTGAFIGTVATGIAVAKIVSPRSNARMIEGIGKSFSSTLGAMTGEALRAGRDNVELAKYQRGGTSIIDVNTPAKPTASNTSVWKQGYDLANERYPELRTVRYGHRSIVHILWSLFPQVRTPYVVNWPGIAERLSGVSAADDMELLGDIIGELWDRNGL